MKTTIKQRLHAVLADIRQTALGCGRNPEDIRLVAVAKTHPVSAVQEVIEAGAAIIGENYVQEARDKFNALLDRDVQWHFIGHLQRNKAKYAVRMFDLIHSVDSVRLATELDKASRKVGKIQDILIQVNISGELSKSGVSEAEIMDVLQGMAPLENIRVKGLMTMPPFFDAPEKARPYFAALRRLKDRICLGNMPSITMEELSMGMTGDFRVAIEEGATLVRIGTAIFGAR